MDLLTAQNLPWVLGAVLSPGAAYFISAAIRGIIDWRKGASEEDKNLLLDTLAQLERCNRDRDTARDQADRYRQQVGRRDYQLLSHGMEPPDD